jgi:N-methylhydantoinase A
VLKVIDTLKGLGITAVAVCLLHSYANPDHEIRLKELFAEHYPQATVSLSCEILPEIREYERMSTTVINSYVMPIIEGYLAVLEGRMKDTGLSVDLNVMQSNGGVMPARSAGKKSVATILSGPAGGVLGSQWLVSLAGIEDVITLDIGGTSSDICLISQGSFLSTTESEIGGHAIKVPMIDINTIGAGGGSIAWIDQGGSLRVGPQSAGADPGPACYGKGGTKPTVTDANLVLGRLNPDFYVGGEMSLDSVKAEKAVREHVADPLGMTLQQAAEGILQVVNANMIRGIRRVSVERGYDPRQFSLMAFGGGGPLHATQLASELNIPKVVVPLTPGVNSAVGIIIADFRYDYSKTFLRHSGETEPGELESAFKELEEQAISEMMSDHLGPEKVVFQRSVDMRYLGQGYEMEIPLSRGIIKHKGLAEISQSFHQHHFKAYGYSQPEEETELVYLRLSAVGQIPKPEFAKYPLAGPDPSNAHKGMREVHLNGKDIEAALYDRSLLSTGNQVNGPAVIEQFDSTTLLDRNQTAYVDEYLNLIVTIAGEQNK